MRSGAEEAGPGSLPDPSRSRSARWRSPRSGPYSTQSSPVAAIAIGRRLLLCTHPLCYWRSSVSNVLAWQVRAGTPSLPVVPVAPSAPRFPASSVRGPLRATHARNEAPTVAALPDAIQSRVEGARDSSRRGLGEWAAERTSARRPPTGRSRSARRTSHHWQKPSTDARRRRRSPEPWAHSRQAFLERRRAPADLGAECRCSRRLVLAQQQVPRQLQRAAHRARFASRSPPSYW